MNLVINDIEVRLSNLFERLNYTEYLELIHNNEELSYYDRIISDESIVDYTEYFSAELLNKIYNIIDEQNKK